MKKVTKIGARRPVKKLGTYKGTKPSLILTPKQQAFVDAIVRGKIGSFKEAYATVYDVALTKTGSVPKWVEVEASKLLANPKVALSIQTAMERRDGATVASSVKTREYVLEQLYKESIGADSDASRIRALELLGKTVGIFTDQIEVKSHRSTEEIDRDLEEKIVQLLAAVEG